MDSHTEEGQNERREKNKRCDKTSPDDTRHLQQLENNEEEVSAHCPIVCLCLSVCLSLLRATRVQPSQKRDPVRVPSDDDQEDDPLKKQEGNKRLTPKRREEDDSIRRKQNNQEDDKRIQPLPEHRNQAQVCVWMEEEQTDRGGTERENRDEQEERRTKPG
ncbi:hypothetical protein Pcinc_044503 [Petrolisthes cinctipes]|uniref:Uncharacterized protein n=1 Tax=Petrolisthes cinctipes TaxID=88211 RepID=A0AAE1K2M0_PETCI|nr:hypothetical protein Pcinc_044503 [Petrolisthes cinctipes]